MRQIGIKLCSIAGQLQIYILCEVKEFWVCITHLAKRLWQS